jgi:hypothetical protein
MPDRSRESAPPRRSRGNRVRDARGWRVPSVSLRSLARADGDGDDRRRDLIARIRRRTRETAWRIAGANALWIMVVAMLWSRLEENLIGRNKFQGLPRGAAALGLLALIVAACWWSASRAIASRRARLAVEAGFCGSCGYHLAGLHPQRDDGLIVCPECGSAWRRVTK